MRDQRIPKPVLILGGSKKDVLGKSNRSPKGWPFRLWTNPSITPLASRGSPNRYKQHRLQQFSCWCPNGVWLCVLSVSRNHSVLLRAPRACRLWLVYAQRTNWQSQPSESQSENQVPSEHHSQRLEQGKTQLQQGKRLQR